MSGLIDPAEGCFAITPNDNTDLERNTRGLYVGAFGDIVLELISGEVLTFVAITAGIIHPLQVKRVYSTGTDATNIIGVY